MQRKQKQKEARKAMTNLINLPAFELIYIIANYGMGSKILHKAKKCGIRGGTIFHGKGTVSNAFLNFLSLYDERKEVILLGADKKNAEEALEELSKHFHFEKPNHGIAFKIGMCGILGSRYCQTKEYMEERGVDGPMYQLIVTIVNRGKAEEVIEAANAVGSKGGTIINARGSGTNETSKLFQMDIEPEKEMVMILSKTEITNLIVTSIKDKLELDEPGNGIVFVQDVNKAYGIYE